MSSTHKITLRPAQPSDIPALIAVSAASFKDDTHTQLKGQAQSPPVTAPEYMTQGAHDFFSSQLARAGATVTAATIHPSENDEQIIAFLVAGSRGTPALRAQQPPLPALVAHRGPIPSSPSPVSASGTIASLAALTDRSMRDWMAWFLAPPPGAAEAACCAFVISLSVHPDHQSSGVGSALLASLTGRCDAEVVPCWVQSSDGAAAFYRKHGFAEVGRLEVELDRFAVGEDGRRVSRPGEEERAWGTYCWRYMERAPQGGGAEGR